MMQTVTLLQQTLTVMMIIHWHNIQTMMLVGTMGYHRIMTVMILIQLLNILNDFDCDGVITEEDCDDANPLAQYTITLLIDGMII